MIIEKQNSWYQMKTHGDFCNECTFPRVVFFLFCLISLCFVLNQMEIYSMGSTNNYRILRETCW